MLIDICPECDRDRNNREPHKPGCTVGRPSAGDQQGYVDAFYELAALLNMPALPIPPMQAWRDYMRPQIELLRASQRHTREAVDAILRGKHGGWDRALADIREALSNPASPV